MQGDHEEMLAAFTAGDVVPPIGRARVHHETGSRPASRGCRTQRG